MLIRENYLDLADPAEFRDSFELLAKEAVGGGLVDAFELSLSDDWREAVVGLQFATICAAQRVTFGRSAWEWATVADVAARYESLVNEVPAFAASPLFRPAMMLLTFLRRDGTPAAFLEPGRYVEDTFEAYAAAFAADRLIEWTGGKRDGLKGVTVLRLEPTAELMARLTEEFGDVTDELVASAQRFADGAALWGGEKYMIRFTA